MYIRRSIPTLISRRLRIGQDPPSFLHLRPFNLTRPITIPTVTKLATEVCEGHSTWARSWGTNVALMEECLDLTFMHELLRLGYEFDQQRELTLGKHVDGTELGWCLGATIAMVGGELQCRI